MHEQAQLRFKKDEVEKLGAEVYVVLPMDLYRTKIFREENLVLSTFKNPFTKEKNLVFGTALSDPAGYASALYGASRNPLFGHVWLENEPTWIGIDRNGKIIYGTWSRNQKDAKQTDADDVLEALKKAAR